MRGRSGSARILVIEDESRIAEPLSASLSSEGFECRVAADGRTGLRMFREEPPDLVILDLMLPEIDGIEVCARVREESDVPILMLTARDSDSDKLLGFESGADDYVTKPFSLPVLEARVRSLLRRARSPARDGEVEVESVVGEGTRFLVSL